MYPLPKMAKKQPLEEYSPTDEEELDGESTIHKPHFQFYYENHSSA